VDLTPKSKKKKRVKFKINKEIYIIDWNFGLVSVSVVVIRVLKIKIVERKGMKVVGVFFLLLF